LTKDVVQQHKTNSQPREFSITCLAPYLLHQYYYYYYCY